MKKFSILGLTLMVASLITAAFVKAENKANFARGQYIAVDPDGTASTCTVGGINCDNTNPGVADASTDTTTAGD